MYLWPVMNGAVVSRCSFCCFFSGCVPVGLNEWLMRAAVMMGRDKVGISAC